MTRRKGVSLAGPVVTEQEMKCERVLGSSHINLRYLPVITTRSPEVTCHYSSWIVHTVMFAKCENWSASSVIGNSRFLNCDFTILTTCTMAKVLSTRLFQTTDLVR